MANQPSYVKLALVSARDGEVRRQHADLAAQGDAHATLTLVGDRGELWRGEHALRVCLWTLREHRRDSFDPRSTALALAEHDAALRVHDRVAPPRAAPRGADPKGSFFQDAVAPRADTPPPRDWAAPAPTTWAPRPPVRESWAQGVCQGVAAGVVGMVLVPLLWVIAIAACALGHELAGWPGALGVLVLCLVVFAKCLAGSERRT